MSGKSSVFDMIGPVMIGPSSSHTAGVVRIGRGGTPLEAGRVAPRGSLAVARVTSATYRARPPRGDRPWRD